MNRELTASTTLSHYRIVSKIGEGGMGEVYLAQDTKLDRRVALKILPADVASNRDRMDRFVREAKSAAALNHPNIAHIYEIGESGGTHYIAMEFIDGDTLRHKIHRDKAPLSKLLKYLIQVAQGLSKAHAAGIVHRDLKPDNIMITRDDYAKVLDFGLAKLVEPQRTFGPKDSGSSEIATAVMQQPGPAGKQSGWDSGHSTPGMVIGTIGYMSPEQASGRVDEIDLRSDIFSFGCILFEAATGQRAFAGKDVLDSLHKIVHAPTPQLKDANPRAPAELQRVVRRCLAKEREKRYQSIKELVIELDDLQQELKGLTESEYSGHPTPAMSPATSAMTRGYEGFRIAILPFKVRDADPGVDVLADGLSEEIVTGLSRFRYLSVVTSTSAASLKGETKDDGSLAAKLGTRYKLEGSIRKGGSAIRVSAQLVDTETGAQLWSETYNRDLQTSTIFAIQDDVAGRIVATVADSYGVLVHSIRAAIRKKDDAELTPVEWQFQYFAYREQITPAAHASLKSRLLRVAEQNVGQSDVWACLAQIYVDEYSFGFEGDANSLDRALAAGRRAVELDRANQFALVALAQVHFFRQDLAAFGPAAERGMSLNPLNSDALGILGLQIVHTGEFDRGTAIVHRAMELNPNHAGWMHFAPLWNHFHKGEYEQALECANRVDVPGLFWPFLVMASACGHLGRRAEAEAAVRDLLALDPEFAAHVRSNVGTWHFASGLMDPILEGLLKAGLSVPATEGSSDSAAKADRAESGTDSGQVRADEGFWVAVLPFKYSGANAELTALAEGLTEDIVTGLSRFSYLKVIARSSTSRYANELVDVRTAGKELGARYVMEGNLRQAGQKLRLAVQLVDALSGAHLWAENYERSFSPEALFELQDDLVPRIVSTVADMHGVLPQSMSAALRSRAPEELSPHEAVLRSFGYLAHIAAEEHAVVRAALERAVEAAPQNADGLAMLSTLYADEHKQGFDGNPDPLGRALEAARRAVAAAPSNHLAYHALAQALFFRKEFPAFRIAAERAVALNPMDACTSAFMGILLAYAGEWERGRPLAERAMELNPNHPGWYRFVLFNDAFRKGDDRGALDIALKFNMPSYFFTHAALAAAYGQLGEKAAGSNALRELLVQKPDFNLVAREELGKWLDPELVERHLEGLRKAGLEIAQEGGSAAPAPERARSSAADSGVARAEEGFWVAVLPFKYSGANVDLTALAEGLTEDIVTGLSRFSYLKVIARSSTSRYANELVDVRTAGKELGARYVMEGNLRQEGGKLRLAVQLVDAVSGAHLWAENYERAYNPEAAFELQDDLVPRIVSTCGDRFGVLARSISDAVRGTEPGQLGPYEALMRGFGYQQRLTPVDHADARDALERAVDRAPSNADCWAMLSWIYSHEHAHGFNVLPGSLDRALAAARRAVDIGPSNQLAQQALAVVLFFRKEPAGCLGAAERAIALNPLDTSNEAIFLIAFNGDWDRGCALIRGAMDLNPHHPRWYELTLAINEYRLADYRGAIDTVAKANAPEVFWGNLLLAAAYGQMGEFHAARQALRDLLAQKPDFGQTAPEMLAKWMDPQLVEHLLEGLRKAGLEIGNEAPASTSSAPSLTSSEIRTDEGFWVAVLPFKYSGTAADLEALAEGLSEDIVTGLSRFSYLRVITRSSTMRFAGEATDVRMAGKELGARYVITGSLRLAGSLLRVAVQLVDASTGANLWAENYERPFRPEEIFALQDELVPKIVATAADRHGVLPHTMSETLRNRDIKDLRPYELVLRGFTYYERATAAEHPLLRAALERAVEQSPGNGDCWAILAIIYCDEYKFGLNPLADSLGRALAAAQKAVEVAVSNSFAYDALAQAHFFRREFESFRNAAERAIALNPLDGATVAWMGTLIAFSGDWDHGCDIVQRATQLNPHHPAWYWSAAFWNAYRKSDYRAALSTAVKYNMPGTFYKQWMLAVAYGQLGERQAANKALQDLLALRPDFAIEVRDETLKWFVPELVEHVIDGARKAGLDIADQPTTSTSSSPSIASSEPRTDEGFWIAVLPFKFTGSNTEVATLAEGLSEEIVTGLSRFSYLRVISRSSTLRYANETDDVRDVGKTLGARYVMEGSLRVAGSSLRISVQLIDASTGAHLWAETYDRQFRAEELFALLDDLVPRIVSTIADVNGVLPRSMSEVVCSKNPDELSPYEAVLRSFRYFDRVTAEELTAARSCLEVALQKAPTNADAWAMLALLFVQDYGQGFNLNPDALNAGALAAQRAVEAGPSNHLAHFSLAQARFFQKELQGFRNAAERAVSLNPMDANALAFVGELFTYVGDSERGIALATRAKQINPNHPGWFWYADFFHAYRQGNYRGALDLILKTNLPGHWGMHAGIAAVNGQLGELEAASKAVRELLTLRPDYGATVHEALAKWFDAELCEQLLDGLRKAGLEIIDENRPAYDARETIISSSFDSRPSIAVLPFLNISNDVDNEYFCDGLSEELLNALSKIESLHVAARTSAFYFKDKQTDIREIGTKLNVSTVLEGSVRKSGNRVRINVQLVSVADGFHLWSEKYDRQLADIFEIQDEITISVTDALKVRLLGKDREVVLKRYTDNAEAYELFLKGRYYHYKYSADGWRRATEFFERAIEKEPNYAPAYAGMNTSLGFLWFLGFLPAEQTVPQMKAAAIKALEIDENLAEAHLSQAMISFFYDWKWPKAEQEFKRAIALDPHNAEAISFYSMFLGFEERFDEAIDQGARALAIDPLSTLINMNVAWTYFSAGLSDKTLEQVAKMIEVEPDFYGCYWLRGAVYLSEGEYDNAVQALKKAVSLGGRQIVLADLGAAYGLAGNNSEATAILGQLLEMRQREYVPAICMARIYSRIGENDKAIDWLEKAFEEKNGEMVFLRGEIDGAAQGDSLNSLGNDPRVIHLLQKMNLP